MGEARARLGQPIDQFRLYGCESLHVAAILGMQHVSGYFITDLIAVLRHFRSMPEHLSRYLELLAHDRRRTFFFRQFETSLPANHSHLFRDPFGERQ